MKYQKTNFIQPMKVQNIISAHYFEYPIDFAFSGELHDFWEFVYVDKGAFFITAGPQELLLRQGQMYIHKPLEFHNVRMTGEQASNSVILSFSCNSRELFGIAGKVIDCGAHERALMAQMIAEAHNAYCTPLGDPYTKQLKRRAASPFACEQLIKIYLELLLIHLVRRDGKAPSPSSGLPRKRGEDAKCKEICDYLQSHAQEILTFSQVCRAFSLSPSTLKKLFRDKMGCGVMDFFQRCKIDRAKELIRENTLNFTEIAEVLNFSSVHYFSRHFKALTDMTPSQYAASVKAMQQQFAQKSKKTG